MTVYLSGPITGMANNNTESFEHAEHVLRSQGHEVINPLRLEHNHDKSWRSYMRECITALMSADLIVMLDGWMESSGAIIEHHLALSVGIEAHYWPDMED